ncbi:MAG: hypothetical protein CM1200mP30_11590 [Pseudomonadota bacterium]|nr:MAG: hypothetical protein CM1200mP30_11590 [Pseudomonadota bacterium]
MTGLHALHVIGGMVIMALISFDILKGYNFQRVELIGIYWHFVDWSGFSYFLFFTLQIFNKILNIENIMSSSHAHPNYVKIWFWLGILL